MKKFLIKLWNYILLQLFTKIINLYDMQKNLLLKLIVDVYEINYNYLDNPDKYKLYI